MQNTSASSKIYFEEIDNRNSMDPMYPSPAIVHTNHSGSSLLSVDTTENGSTRINDSEPQLIDKSKGHGEENLPRTRMEKFKAAMKMIRPTAEMLFFDVALPLALYYILKIWLSTLIALIISGIPPLLRVIYLFWRKRRVDILGCIFVVSFILSAVLSIISGDARLALLRDSTTTAIISLMFFVTLIPLRTKWFTVRPLIFLFAQEMMAEADPIKWTDIEGEEHSLPLMEWVWRECRFFRQYCYVLCALWSAVLMGEFIAKVIMIKSTLTVDQIVLYGNIIVIVVIVVMTVGSTIYTRRMRKKIVVVAKEWREKNDFTERFANK